MSAAYELREFAEHYQQQDYMGFIKLFIPAFISAFASVQPSFKSDAPEHVSTAKRSHTFMFPLTRTRSAPATLFSRHCDAFPTSNPCADMQSSSCPCFSPLSRRTMKRMARSP